MKNFKQYLTESEKSYNWKIRIAGEIPEDCSDKMKMALGKFDLANLSSPKTSPIQETPLDFPQIQNCEVHTWDAELKYPTTGPVLEKLLMDVCRVHDNHIVVRGEHEPLEAYQEKKDDKPYEVLMTKEDMGGDPEAQKTVGDSRVMELLKELEKTRSEREEDPMANVPQGESADIDPKMNTQAVVGN